MRRDLFLVLASCLVEVSTTVNAQAPSGPRIDEPMKSFAGFVPENVGRTIVTAGQPPPPPGADPLILGNVFDPLSAAVTAREKGTKFQASFVPGSLIDDYWPVLSELGVTLMSDTANSLTRMSLSGGYNRFAMRGDRANRIVNESVHELGCGTKFDKNLEDCRASCGEYTSEEQKQTCQGTCTEYKTKADLVCSRRTQAREWQKLNDSWVPSVTTSISADLFPAELANDTPPGATSWGGFTLQLGLTWKKFEIAQLDIWATYKPWWRSSGTSTGSSASGMGRYFGGGATWSWLFSLLDRDRPEQSLDYVKSGFLAGLGLGVSVQAARCMDGFCDKNRDTQASVTPFGDVRLKPEVQFRLSFPLTYYTVAGSNGTAASVVLTFATAIGSVK